MSRRRPSSRVPYQHCAVCGSNGRRVSETCRDCLHAPLELVGGQWVIDLRRRVMVWEKAS